MNKPLVKAVLKTIDFFANCDDDVLDPDVAVEQLESIGSAMNQLTTSEKKEFIRMTNRVADELNASDPDTANFFRSVPEHLGLL